MRLQLREYIGGVRSSIAKYGKCCHAFRKCCKARFQGTGTADVVVQDLHVEGGNQRRR